ncbi:hypothetical protein IQ241_19200 [Romeria aff. gracilis LEGE 07310]|uniref:Uncharacterized protein n=1 Tax=Vasconcelosia minhoensis LEGE 07310 TaxID=915328 RepID=A0A8J7A8W3_9CYAN|nr:hypothetical protein [Romeria gracilis]MBE9079397.1 hypothetical protein [Romeria aff. gracilis LEGE 07310]
MHPDDNKIFAPYVKGLQDMFSLDVFPEDDPIWSNHPDTIRFMNSARDLLRELMKSMPS